MEFSEEKFELLSHGKIFDGMVTPYVGPTGKEISDEHQVKDLRIIMNKKLEYGDYIDKTTRQVMSGVIMRTFPMRGRKLIMKMFTVDIKSKFEHCCIVWSPSK